MARLVPVLLLAAGASAHVEFGARGDKWLWRTARLGSLSTTRAGNYKLTQLAEEISSFLVVGEWGGQSAAPYTTPGQLAAAQGMATVAAAVSTAFVVSPGGNFYDDGIQGA